MSRSVVLLAVALGAAVPAVTPGGLVPVRVDHHVHLNSPAITAFLPDFCASVKRYGGCDPALVAPHSPADLLAAMDRAGIRRSVVLTGG
jgi:hypothetical protein